MHELSICHSMLQQVESLALQYQASVVTNITLQIGPLSGVEAQLLAQAFPIAAAGSIADGAVLELEVLPIRVRCQKCQAETQASVNRLACGKCGHGRTQLLSGDEMLLASVEMHTPAVN